jgi:hypothetical protein
VDQIPGWRAEIVVRVNCEERVTAGSIVLMHTVLAWSMQRLLWRRIKCDLLLLVLLLLVLLLLLLVVVLLFLMLMLLLLLLMVMHWNSWRLLHWGIHRRAREILGYYSLYGVLGDDTVDVVVDTVDVVDGAAVAVAVVAGRVACDRNATLEFRIMICVYFKRILRPKFPRYFWVQLWLCVLINMPRRCR